MYINKKRYESMQEEIKILRAKIDILVYRDNMLDVYNVEIDWKMNKDLEKSYWFGSKDNEKG
jgi:isocitrate dehydrogenase